MAFKQHHLLALESGKVYAVTLKNLNTLSLSNRRLKIGFLKTTLGNFVRLTSIESPTCKLLIEYIFFMTIRFRGGFTGRVIPGVQVFVAIVNDCSY